MSAEFNSAQQIRVSQPTFHRNLNAHYMTPDDKNSAGRPLHNADRQSCITCMCKGGPAESTKRTSLLNHPSLGT
ncbi:uncharacterized protein LOC143174968 isoform X2 [Nomia melanderi]|uniref:uncharacterized protein LOC143174968 isoform X2 n=1 Tax=Nomia melanderi TaxID=2448451 RepID=UPI003FCE2E07